MNLILSVVQKKKKKNEGEEQGNQMQVQWNCPQSNKGLCHELSKQLLGAAGPQKDSLKNVLVYTWKEAHRVNYCPTLEA